MQSARQIAINALELVPNLKIEIDDDIILPGILLKFLNDDENIIYRTGPDKWIIDTTQSNFIENATKKQVKAYISRLRNIIRIELWDFSNRDDPVDTKVIYYCDPLAGHHNCEAQIEDSIRTVQRLFRLKRQRYRQRLRHQISEELINAPPMTSLPKGGYKYQEALKHFYSPSPSPSV